MIDFLSFADPWLQFAASAIIIFSFAYKVCHTISRKVSPPIRAFIGRSQSCYSDWRTRRIAFNHLKETGGVQFAGVSDPKSTAIVTRFGINRSWLTDGRYFSALEKLREQKKVIRTPVFNRSSYPLSQVATRYMLVPPGQGWQEAEESALIEASCEQFSHFHLDENPCDHPNRYARHPSFAKTTDSGVRYYAGARYLTADAPPCALCFQRTPKYLKHIRYEQHVNNLLKHDFASYNQEHLAPVIIRACIETDCDETLHFVKGVVKEALKLSQLEHGRDKSEIQAKLETYIRSQQEEPE